MATNNAANNATAATGKVLRAQGVGVASTYSTATYPDTSGTSGNLLTSDGTNWNSTAPAASVYYSAYAPWICASATVDATANYQDGNSLFQTPLTAAIATGPSATAPVTLFLKNGNYGAGTNYTFGTGINLVGADPYTSSTVGGANISALTQYGVRISGFFTSGNVGTNTFSNLLIRASASQVFSGAVNIVRDCRISCGATAMTANTSFFNDCQLEGGLAGTTYVNNCILFGFSAAAILPSGTHFISNSNLTNNFTACTATMYNSKLNSCVCTGTCTLTLTDCTIIGGVTALIGGTATTVKCVNCNDGTNKITDGTYPAATPSNQVLYSDSTFLNKSVVNGTTGQLFTATTSAAPSWTTAAYPSTSTINQVLYSSAANTITGLATANSGVLATSSTGVPSINQNIAISANGEVTMALQPSFLAYVDTTIPNVSGDGTVYKIIFDTEVFDRNADFNLGTSTFTSPVTGLYFLQFACLATGGTVITAANARIVTTARTYNNTMNLSPGTTDAGGTSFSVLANMTAGDTATFTIQCTDSGGKILDVFGAAGGDLRNYVSGYLVC